MQKLIITIDDSNDEDEILAVLQALKNGEQVATCAGVKFTCEVTADTQGYLLAEPIHATRNDELVGYVDVLGRS